MPNHQILLDALQTSRALQITYENRSKTVEVHAFNETHVRVMQVPPTDTSRPLPNWALLIIDKITNPTLTDIPSEAPRPGYRQGDKHLPNIIAEIKDAT